VGVDDHFLCFVYSKNYAAGFENFPLEGERLERFSILWTGAFKSSMYIPYRSLVFPMIV
jgi:hypothetical protein